MLNAFGFSEGIGLCHCAQKWAVIISVLPMNDLSEKVSNCQAGGMFVLCPYKCTMEVLKSSLFIMPFSCMCVHTWMHTQTPVGSSRGMQHEECDGHFASICL